MRCDVSGYLFSAGCGVAANASTACGMRTCGTVERRRISLVTEKALCYTIHLMAVIITMMMMIIIITKPTTLTQLNSKHLHLKKEIKINKK